MSRSQREPAPRSTDSRLQPVSARNAANVLTASWLPACISASLSVSISMPSPEWSPWQSTWCSVAARAVEAMRQIDDASRRIADIIGVIDGIAFQTNILALNAAVEAARAGEQGRGFAVVASEVRSLAGRSATAAKEIKTLIGESVANVDQGCKLVEQAGSTMHELVSGVRRVADIMAEISSASGEQSLGIDQINQAVRQMDQVTQGNAALVEESAAAAESLATQARANKCSLLC